MVPGVKVDVVTESEWSASIFDGLVEPQRRFGNDSVKRNVKRNVIM